MAGKSIACLQACLDTSHARCLWYLSGLLHSRLQGLHTLSATTTCVNTRPVSAASAAALYSHRRPKLAEMRLFSFFIRLMELLSLPAGGTTWETKHWHITYLPHAMSCSRVFTGLCHIYHAFTTDTSLCAGHVLCPESKKVDRTWHLRNGSLCLLEFHVTKIVRLAIHANSRQELPTTTAMLFPYCQIHKNCSAALNGFSALRLWIRDPGLVFHHVFCLQHQNTASLLQCGVTVPQSPSLFLTLVTKC